MGLLDNKVVIITGGATGMGANHVRRCLNEGARVVFGDLKITEGNKLASELGDRVRFVKHNVVDENDWHAIVNEAEQTFGGVDVLVNNAGIHHNCLLENETIDNMRSFHEVNVLGPFLGAQSVLRAMKRRGGGSIINISSLAGVRGIEGYSAYGSTKWAIRGLTQIWAREFGEYNIRVNSIMPGAISQTSMFVFDKASQDALLAGLPIKRAGLPDDISHMITFLASDRSSYITGAEHVIDGGRIIW